MAKLGTIAHAAPPEPSGRAGPYNGLTGPGPPTQPGDEISTHLSAIVGASEDAFISTSVDGTIVVWNDAAERLYGYSAAEAAGRSVTLLLPPGHSYDLQGLLRRMTAGETINQTETVLVRKDGTHIDASVSMFPINDAAGNLIGTGAVTRDITGRKSIENELHRWRDQLQAIVQGVDDAVVIRGPGGRVVYANENAARLLGFNSSHELIANPTEDTYKRFEFYTQEGEYIPPERLPGMLALGGTETMPTPMRFRLLPDGEDRWAIIKSVPIRGEHGKVEYAASIFSDITEQVRAEEALKASEARFQAFMHNSPVVAFMKDEAGRVVFLNHAWEQLFGVPVADALGKNDYELQPPDLAEHFHSADMEVLETGEVKVIPETVPASDGTLRHWMTFKFPIVLPSGARFVGGASVEITERVRAEEELQRYAERLQALSHQLIEAQEAERRRIARDLHDQVGQSLTAIKIDLQVAQHQSAAAEAGQEAVPGNMYEQYPDGRSPHALFAERLGKSIEMVERTIQQVREFSLDLRPSILDDLGLPSALLWYADEQARRAGFTTELAVEQLPARLSPELEITCFRVAQEAITNVVRHAGANHLSVQLRKNEEELVLTVTDDGAGFDPQALSSGAAVEPRDPEAKRTNSVNRIKALGLAGMNERVYLVGGSLSILSTPGTGTTVRAVFPLKGRGPWARE